MKYKKLSVVFGLLLGLFLQAQAAPVKNVIWLIGDGLGPEILGFWMQGVRYGKLSDYPSGVSHTETLMNQAVWGMFFNNTYDTLVTDSAAAATQMATGKFSRPLFIGLDYEEQPVPTLLEMAQQHGKAIGIISDTYVTDATPASFTAHTLTRRNKYEIARQQIDLAPEVILGGGLQYFNQGENKNLLHVARQKGYHLAQNKKQLAKVKSGKLLGLFAEQAMPMAVELYKYPQVPSLTQMTQKAVELLEKDKDGFILMVEAGKIDWAAHANDPGAVLAEMKVFDELVGYLTGYVQKHPDTLLYINADHDTGLGGFVYQQLNAAQAASKTAQGEVLYDNDTDYASFNSYGLFEKQKRSLYYVYNELNAMPAEKRTPEVLEQKLSQALGYKVDITQFENLTDLKGIFIQLNAQRGMAYATMNHSSAPIVSLAYGPQAGAFNGIYHNIDILPRLTQALGWAQN